MEHPYEGNQTANALMSQLKERSEVSMVVGIFRGDHPSKAPHRDKSRGYRKETGEIIVEDRKTKHTQTQKT